MEYAFLDCRFSERDNTLRRGEEVLRVEPRALSLLGYLIRHRDRIVPKGELLEVLWQRTVVSESSLHRCVSILRTALEEQPDTSIIQTSRGNGYRFVASVELLSSSADDREEEIRRLRDVNSTSDPERRPHHIEALSALELASGYFADGQAHLLEAAELARGAALGC